LFELDPKTPSVALVYDSVYPRLKEIRDGANNLRIGYNYHPYRAGSQSPVSLGAGALSRVDEVVLGAAILLDYDALGRVRERAIHSVEEGNLVDDNHRVVVEYDAIGRVTEMTDVLGRFEYEYDQPGKGLSRLARVGYPNGQETLYSWHPAAGHHRLSQIRHRRSNEDLISEYGYHYGHGGQLRAWTQQVGAEALEHWVLEHDEADQLRSVVVREGGGTGTMQRQQYYSYDAGGNRTGYQEGNSVRALAYNALNQIISQPTGAPVRFEGTLDETGTVSINNQSATMRTVLDENETPSFRFGADVPLASGVHQVTVEARDGSGNVTEQHYEVEVGALTGQGVPEYDARGNMKSNGRGQAYEWDAANRLLAIEYADGSRTEFEYDALSRRVREVEKDEEGEVIGEKRLLWVGLGIAQERDAQNAVVKRHAGNGVALADASKYYYTRDHLGSVRQVVDEGEVVVESYSYDAYGVSVASAPGGPNGVRLADFRYTGHYYHGKSGLHMAPYRAYDAELGVWISEDPIEEAGGINLYGYVENGPMTSVDPLGQVGFNADGSFNFGWSDAGVIAGAIGAGAMQCLDAMNPFDDPFLRGGLIPEEFDTNFGAEIAGYTNPTALGASGLVKLNKISGGIKQWIRVGKSYSHSQGKAISLCVRWGASPKYADKIINSTLRKINQALRKMKLPGRSWRTQDPGHFHLRE
jgi:RHS repeat-associated protein